MMPSSPKPAQCSVGKQLILIKHGPAPINTMARLAVFQVTEGDAGLGFCRDGAAPWWQVRAQGRPRRSSGARAAFGRFMRIV